MNKQSSIVWLVFGAIASWCVATAGAANIVDGGVDSGGQAGACTVDRQSSIFPSSGVHGIQIASGSCQTAAAPSGGGGGGDGQSSGTSSTDSSTSTTSSQTSTSSTGNTSKSKQSSSSKAKAPIGTVIAARAVGIRIESVRFTTVGPAWRRRLMVVVALRDRHGRPIRAGVVAITGIAGARSTVSHPFLGFSGMLGKATFSLPVTSGMAGERLLVRITARTPKATAWTLGAKRLPKLARS